MKPLLFSILFHVIPLVASIYFIRCLFSYCSTKRSHKRNPYGFPTELLRRRRNRLIASGIAAGIIDSVYIVIVVLCYMILAHM